MSVHKQKPALNVGKTVGLLLTKVCQSKYSAALRTDNRQAQENATNVKELIEAEWNSRVNRSAVRPMQTEKK